VKYSIKVNIPAFLEKIAERKTNIKKFTEAVRQAPNSYAGKGDTICASADIMTNQHNNLTENTKQRWCSSAKDWTFSEGLELHGND